MKANNVSRRVSRALASAASLSVLAAIGCGEEMEDDQAGEESLLISEQAITHGTQADARDYVASLQVNTSSGWQHTCGATLVKSRWLLTAAHCVDSAQMRNAVSNGSVRVCVGTHSLNQCSSARTAKVKTIKIHPKWRSNGSALGFDVAVLRVSTSKFEDFEKVTLARSDDHDPSAGQEGRSLGWGYTQTGALPTLLRQALLPRLPASTCDDIKSYLGTSGPLLCMDVEQQRSICNGDSGGPMMFRGRQVGVHSFTLSDPNQPNPGLRCAQGVANGMARVSKLDGWILSAMN